MRLEVLYNEYLCLVAICTFLYVLHFLYVWPLFNVSLVDEKKGTRVYKKDGMTMITIF